MSPLSDNNIYNRRSIPFFFKYFVFNKNVTFNDSRFLGFYDCLMTMTKQKVETFENSRRKCEQANYV